MKKEHRRRLYRLPVFFLFSSIYLFTIQDRAFLYHHRYTLKPIENATLFMNATNPKSVVSFS